MSETDDRASQPTEVDETHRRTRWPRCGPALEALLMVADQPMETVTLATAVGYPVDEVTEALDGARRGVRPSRGAASSCATSAVAGATTRATSSPRSSRATSSTASRRG